MMNSYNDYDDNNNSKDCPVCTGREEKVVSGANSSCLFPSLAPSLTGCVDKRVPSVI